MHTLAGHLEPGFVGAPPCAMADAPRGRLSLGLGGHSMREVEVDTVVPSSSPATSLSMRFLAVNGVPCSAVSVRWGLLTPWVPPVSGLN